MYLQSILIYFFIYISSIFSFNRFLKYRNTTERFYKIKLKYIFFFLTIIIPSIFAAIRFNVGSDYQSYVLIYENIKIFSIIEYFTYYVNIYTTEPLFYLLCRLVYIVGGNLYVFLFVCELIIMLFIILGIMNFNFKKYNELALFIYFLSLFPLSLNIIRQAIAISIAFYAVSLFFKEKYFYTFIYIVISTCFHFSALFFLLIYLFYPFDIEDKYIKIKDYVYVFFIIVTPFSTYLFIHLLQYIPLVNKYIKDYGIILGNGGIGFLINIVPILFILIKFGKKEFLKNNKILMFLYLLQIPFGYLGYYVPWSVRLVYYLKVLELVLIPQLIMFLKEEKEKKIVLLIILSYYVLQYVYLFIYLNQNETFPYKTIFNL